MNSKDLKLNFDQIAHRYNIIDQLSFGLTSRYRRKLIDDLQLPASKKVLDLMCGSGANLKPLNKHGVADGQYTGIDFSEKMIALARDTFPHRKFMLNDVMNMNFERFEGYNCICTYGLKCFSEKELQAFMEKAVVFKKVAFLEIFEPEAGLWKLFFRGYLNMVVRCAIFLRFGNLSPFHAFKKAIGRKSELLRHLRNLPTCHLHQSLGGLFVTVQICKAESMKKKKEIK